MVLWFTDEEAFYCCHTLKPNEKKKKKQIYWQKHDYNKQGEDMMAVLAKGELRTKPEQGVNTKLQIFNKAYTVNRALVKEKHKAW